MSATMHCNNPCNYDGHRTVAAIVTDVVTYFRNRGHNRDIAIEQTALALGLSPRKTRSIFYDQAFALLDCEIARIRDRFVRHLEWQADDYARRSDAVKAKLRQMEIGI